MNGKRPGPVRLTGQYVCASAADVSHLVATTARNDPSERKVFGTLRAAYMCLALRKLNSEYRSERSHLVATTARNVPCERKDVFGTCSKGQRMCLAFKIQQQISPRAISHWVATTARNVPCERREVFGTCSEEQHECPAIQIQQ